MSEPSVAPIQAWQTAPKKHDVSEAIERTGTQMASLVRGGQTPSCHVFHAFTKSSTIVFTSGLWAKPLPTKQTLRNKMIESFLPSSFLLIQMLPNTADKLRRPHRLRPRRQLHPLVGGHAPYRLTSAMPTYAQLAGPASSSSARIDLPEREPKALSAPVLDGSDERQTTVAEKRQAQVFTRGIPVRRIVSRTAPTPTIRPQRR
jgi:hypothetical protein